MKENGQKVFTSPLFVLGLFALLLNDFYLKQEFSNFITGKLSDFAGLFIFPLFLAVVWPRRKIFLYVLTALLFLVWKLPFSQVGIDLWNSLGIFKIHRVADYTDLVGLLILPLSYLYLESGIRETNEFIPKSSGRFISTFIAIVSVFAFTATTMADEAHVSLDGEYVLELTNSQIENGLEKNDKIRDIKVVAETDFYPSNTDFDPNGYYVDFYLKQPTCDSQVVLMSFHIQRENKDAKIKALGADFRCRAEKMAPEANRVLDNYRRELSVAFKREVIEILGQNSTR